MKIPKQEEILEKYPYLKAMASSTLFTTEEDSDKLLAGKKIKVNKKEVSLEFLQRILTDDAYFEYVHKYLTGEIKRFRFGYPLYHNLTDFSSFTNCFVYTKYEIVKGLEKAIRAKEITVTQSQFKKYKLLKETIPYEPLLSNEENFEIDIEGNHYSIPVKRIMSFMNLPIDQFNVYCTNDEIKEIDGIPKRYFIYAVLYYFQDKKIKNNYLIPDIMMKHYNDLNESQLIDIESVNKYEGSNETIHNKIEIDSELKDAILSGMPNDATPLEKAIYVYIKMCKLLTYDDEYYAVAQQGKATEKHREFDYIKTITLKNNKVVCFEFNIMYSRLLSELGIKFESNYYGNPEYIYGLAHADLTFKTGKFIISADSVTKLLSGDLTRAKNNEPLIGLTCKNRNKQTQKEFNDAKRKMYKLIATQDKSIEKTKEIEHKPTLEELIGEYSHVTKNIRRIPIQDRITILFDKIKQNQLKGVDALSYLLEIANLIFNSSHNDNINITILRDANAIEEGRIATASAIISVNTNGFNADIDSTLYYLYNPQKGIELLSKEIIQERFKDGTLGYINKINSIPGIDKKGISTYDL